MMGCRRTGCMQGERRRLWWRQASTFVTRLTCRSQSPVATAWPSMSARSGHVHHLANLLTMACPLPPCPTLLEKAGLQSPQLVRLDTETRISPELRLAFFTVRWAVSRAGGWGWGLGAGGGSGTMGARGCWGTEAEWWAGWCSLQMPGRALPCGCHGDGAMPAASGGGHWRERRVTAGAQLQAAPA